MSPRSEYDEDPDCRPLVTRGVTSQVFGDHEVIGHVALTDWDHPPGDVGEAIAATGAPAVMFTSSAGSYHLWDLGVRSIVETDELLHAFEDDERHREIGNDRGWWRIRTDPKIDVEGLAYKPAPEFVDVYEPETWEGPISWPHLCYVRLMADVEIPAWEESTEAVGETIKVVEYVTFTEDEKAVRRRVV